MLSFKTLTGEVLAYGNKGTYQIDNEKAFILSLDKQARAANLKNQDHVIALQHNLNQISKVLELDALRESGIADDPTIAALQYFTQYSDLFKEHGITAHIDARKLEKTVNPAFTETEYPPTIDEMKALEVDIGKLYEDEGTT